MSSGTQTTTQPLGKIASIVREVEKLSDPEKLLLYLQLPCGRANLNLAGEGPAASAGAGQRHHHKSSSGQQQQHQKPTASSSTIGVGASAGAGDELIICAPKKPDNETTLTYTWILSHLEEDPNISLPKQEVYDEYRAFCQANRFEPLCVADFGKAMKHALPCIKPRRLGQRGNSRYCYSGLRKKYRIDPPTCADLTAPDLTPPVRHPPPPPPPLPLPHGSKRSADQQSTSGRLSAPGQAKHHAPGAHQQQQQQQYQRHPAQSHASGVLRNMHALDLPSGGSSGSGGANGGGCGDGDDCQQGRSHTGSLKSFSSGSGGLSSSANPAHHHQKHLKMESPTMCSAEGCDGGVNSPKQRRQVAAACCAQVSSASTCVIQGEPTGQRQAYGAVDPNRGTAACVIDYTPNHPQHHNSALGNNNNNNNNNHHQPHQQQHYSNHPLPQPPLVNNAINGQAPYQQQQQQQPSGYLPRPGTPDDDDYRHNYHDLNRPIIGPAIIPFSQSMSVQLAKQPAPHESFISYNNTSYPPAPAPLSQQQQPAAAIPPTPANHQQQQQLHHMAMVPSCCSHDTSLTSGANITMTTQTASASNSAGDTSSAAHHFDGSPVRNHTLAHLNLNTESADMDFASPFQSPASTPHSSMLSSYLGGGGGGGGGQETQDYYLQQDCSNIPYPDL